MDQFYVTLPSNASMNIFPNNKKSNYTTQFNTPIVLDGNYEVALANITCTPNIINDLGYINIKNLHEVYPFLPKNFDVPIKLDNVKNLQDKINIEMQEMISIIQFGLNSKMFILLEKPADYYTMLSGRIPVFYNFSEQHDPTAKYYIPKQFNENFDLEIEKEKEVTFQNNYVVLTRDQFFDFVDGQYDLSYYPLFSVYQNSITNDKFFEDFMNYYEEKTLNPSLKNERYDITLAAIKKINENLSKSIQFAGLITIRAEVYNNKIKLISNIPLFLQASGIIKDLVFKNEMILLDTFYPMPGNLNLIKYGIIYCDIVQEQIVGEEYRQVLQIIPLNSTESSQVLSNNLDLQYVPVKSNYITSINISIKSLTGDYIKFDDDFIYTIVKLHFRKIL
jgi:hypothetical protein